MSLTLFPKTAVPGGRRTAVDGPTAVPGRPPSRFFLCGGLGAAAPRAPGGFGGAGAPPIGGVWGGEAPPGKNDWLRALKNKGFMINFSFLVNQVF